MFIVEPSYNRGKPLNTTNFFTWENSLGIISIICVILSILLFIYILSKKYKNKSEETMISSGDQLIVDKDVPAGELPLYYLQIDGKEKLIASGKWSLKDKKIIIDDNGKKKEINKKKNIYEIDDSKIIYKNNGSCGDIIIDNNKDELKICFDGKNYTITRGKDIIIEIQHTSSQDKKDIFSIINDKKDKIDKNISNLMTIIAAFIIFNQNEIDINTSYD